jgi:hypothetical protein
MISGLLAPVRHLAARPTVFRTARSQRRSARAALVCGLLFALTAMAGMSAALETVKPEWRDPEYGYRLHKLKQLRRESPNRPLVLLLGTSRTQYALDPSAMGFPDGPGSPLVFNFGQSASPPLKVFLTLLRLWNEGIRPAAVVVEVLPVWLSSVGPAEVQLRGAEARLTAADLYRLAPYCDDSSELTSRWFAARIAPWQSQRAVLMSHWLPRWLHWSDRIDQQWQSIQHNGFIPFPRQLETDGHRAIATDHARAELARAFRGFGFGRNSVRVLRDLVAFCREHGIAIALAQPPVSPMFRNWFRPGAWTSGDTRLRVLAGELGVELFPPYEGLDESDYIDGHHLLRRGAEKYSLWLAETHLRPWLDRQGAR